MELGLGLAVHNIIFNIIGIIIVCLWRRSGVEIETHIRAHRAAYLIAIQEQNPTGLFHIYSFHRNTD